MNYELVKQLKDAGFPQESREDGFYITDMGIRVHTPFQLTDPSKAAYYPILSELIEACGDRFESLIRVGSESRYWQTYSNKWVDGDQYEKGFIAAPGSTPEEAVAKLWLVLKESKSL